MVGMASTQRAPALQRGLATLRRVVTGRDAPILIALVLGVGALVEGAVRYGDTSDRQQASLLGLMSTVPIALGRRLVLLSAVLVEVATFIVANAPDRYFTVCGLLGLLFIMFLVASTNARWVSALFLVPFVMNVMIPIGDEDAGLSPTLLLVLVVSALVLGDAEQRRGQVVAERDATRAEYAATLRESAAMEERARIARELHDVVAHNLSMISVQAETARLTTDGLSAEGQQRFVSIGETAREALTEMRRLLGVLRDDAGGVAERAPQPGLDQLAALLDDACEAGTPVRLVMQGRVAPLPSGVDLTAYRIVQEALSNARQHAPGARVDIELDYTPDALTVSVRDDGPGPAPEGETAGSGHGLLGMRERVAMVGGQLVTGTADGGGFLVEARLPIAEPRP
jgi:signal transduction histidine kinase